MIQKHRRELLLASLAFAAILVTFFWPAFLQGKFLYQGDLTGSDLLELNVPRRLLVAQAFREGEVPLWEPKIGNGTQLLAEGHPGPFYPLTVPLYALFSPTVATNLTLFLTLFVALLGCYVWLRLLGASSKPAILGALAFSLGGTFIFRLKNLNIIEIISWLPLCLALITLYRRRAHWGTLLALVLVWAAQLVAGHPQAAFIAQITCWSYALWLNIIKVDLGSPSLSTPSSPSLSTTGSPSLSATDSPTSRPNEPPVSASAVDTIHTAPPSKKSFLVSLAVAAILALLLSAIQLVPTLAFARESTRAQMYGDDYLLSQALNAHHFRRFIEPYCDGNPTIATFTLTRQDLIWESTPYIGLLPLALILFAWAGKRRQTAWGLGILGALFLTLAFGPRTFLFNLLSRYFPGFGFFRYPERFIIPMALFLSALSALGMQTILDWCAPTRRRLARVMAIGVIILTLADLYRVSNAFQSYLPSDWYRPPQSIASLGTSPQRILAPTEWLTMYNSVAENGWRDNTAPVMADITALPPDIAPIWGIASAADYNSIGGGMSIEHFTKLFTWISANLFNTTYNQQSNNFFIQPAVLPWLRLSNISHIVTYIPLKDGAHAYGVSQAQALNIDCAPGRTLYVYQLTDPLPALRLVPHLVDKQPYELSKGLAPLPDGSDSLYEPDPEHPANVGKVSVVGQSRNSLELETQCETNSYLVLSRTYHPQWLASIDGHTPQPVLKVNYAFQAISVPAGKHHIALRFTSPSFAWGWKISAAGWLLLFGLTRWCYKRKATTP